MDYCIVSAAGATLKWVVGETSIESTNTEDRIHINGDGELVIKDIRVEDKGIVKATVEVEEGLPVYQLNSLEICK